MFIQEQDKASHISKIKLLIIDENKIDSMNQPIT